MRTLLLITIAIQLVSCGPRQGQQKIIEKSVPTEGKPVQVEDQRQLGKCSGYDVTEFLKTYKDYGTDGIFDTTYQRIQFHFEAVKRSEGNGCVYMVTGFDRLKGLVTPFKGEIKIHEIVKNQGNIYAPETPSDDKLIEFKGVYVLREDSTARGSGIFEGQVSFMLTDYNAKLVDDMLEYMGDGFSNFIYEGTWTSYATGKVKKCIWGQGRLPNTGDFDIGDGDQVVNEKYLKYGWERNSDWTLKDNPARWWHKQKNGG